MGLVIIDVVTDRQVQISVLVALAAIATVYSLVQPLLAKDRLQERMKSVADHRERLRQKQRDSFNKRAGLRNNPEGWLKEVSDSLKMFEIFDIDEARKKLMQAGFRGEKAVAVFMACRLGMPFVSAVAAGLYVYVFGGEDIDNFTKLMAVFAAFIGGTYLPILYIKNVRTKRQKIIQLAWPDALDLLLICVESGMSIEAAFQKVSIEIGAGCAELAEELGLTVAELSYLQERRQAYLNLADRIGLETIKAVTTALVQSEKYGTPLGQSLRVLATENRELRMQEAEKKAAALPPKLTVPMIGFFLPVLFAVIIGPAVLGIMGIESAS